MKKTLKGRILIFTALSVTVLLCLAACTTGNKGDSKDSTPNQTEPQYYMAHNSAAAENGYYYITGDVVSSDGLKYLYFYDFSARHQYPVCSKLTCGHHDETCDAHIIVNNIMENAIWYYNNRLYMVEKAEEYDRIISYDLQGRDRQNHSVLSTDGIAVLEGVKSDSIAFYDGYVYYISLANRYEPALYRIGIAENSSPEFIHTFDNRNGDIPTFTLSALPGRVYVNLALRNYERDTEKYSLDYYDIQTGKYTEAFQADSETSSEDARIAFWRRKSGEGYVLFDDKHNMYYVTTTDTEYIVNKMNTDTGKTEKIFTFSGEMNTKNGMQSTGDEGFIQLQSYDGRYLYISQVVNPSRKIKDFKETTVPYGAGKTLTTQLNVNYIYVLDTDGNCVDILAFKREDSGFRAPSHQLGGINIAFLCGDSRYLLFSTSETQIEGIELTHKEYLAKLKEIYKEIWESKTLDMDMYISVQASFDKSQLGSETHTWLNLVNEQNGEE